MTNLPDVPNSRDETGQCTGAPFGSAEWNLRTYLVPFVLGIFVTLFLWLVSLYNFALYHTTVEVTTIAISVAIFLLIWNSRKIIDNNYLLFLGFTFVFIAILDFLHTLVYQGVGIFADGGGTLSTRFWIAARYMQAVTLLAAPLFIRRKVRLDMVAAIYLAADAIIVASIFIFKVFPATYIAGTGLTPFKIVSEYIIIVLLVAAVWLLWRNRDSFDREVLNNLTIAIFLSIGAELSFTEYASFTDIFSLLGHVFRLVAYYFFYRAIVEVGQKKPYALLYRNLNESEKKYRALIDLSPDAIVVLRDQKILYANQAGLQLVGVTAMNEVAGKNFTNFIVTDDRAASEKRLDAVQNSRITAPLKEVRLECGDRVVPVEVTSGPVEWDRMPAVQVIIRDITGRKRNEEELARKNDDLRAAYEELTATEEELQQNVNELTLREVELREHEKKLTEALAEKEVLLSEIHHRVKNNLTAFISLLSLEGSYEESPAGQALKQDLQNRARSMSLIHETLYRTKKYSTVDMGVYLPTLVEQVSSSYATKKAVAISVRAEGISLDLHRATPVGLIINELITNSFKYAFPDSSDTAPIRASPPAINLSLTRNGGEYELSFRDNGIGLPPGFDIATTQTLGLKLVNFLARHQMRAKVEVSSRQGTEFVFRFKE